MTERKSCSQLLEQISVLRLVREDVDIDRSSSILNNNICFVVKSWPLTDPSGCTLLINFWLTPI